MVFVQLPGLTIKASLFQLVGNHNMYDSQTFGN